MSDYPKLLDGTDEVYGLPVAYINKDDFTSAKNSASQQKKIMEQYYWDPPYSPKVIKTIHPKSTFAIILNGLTTPVVGAETYVSHGYQTGEPVVLDENDSPQRKPKHADGDSSLDWIDAAAMDELSNIASVGSYSFAQHMTFFHGASYVLKLSLPGHQKELYISLQTNSQGGTLWANTGLYDSGKGPTTADFYATTYTSKYEFQNTAEFEQTKSSGSISVTTRYGKKKKYDYFCLFVYIEDTNLEKKLNANIDKAARMAKTKADLFISSYLIGKTPAEIKAFRKRVAVAQINIAATMSQADLIAFLKVYSKGRTKSEIDAFKKEVVKTKKAMDVGSRAARDIAAAAKKIMDALSKFR